MRAKSSKTARLYATVVDRTEKYKAFYLSQQKDTDRVVIFFTRLQALAKELGIGDEDVKAQFLNGLKPSIGDSLYALQNLPISTLIELACRKERMEPKSLMKPKARAGINTVEEKQEKSQDSADIPDINAINGNSTLKEVLGELERMQTRMEQIATSMSSPSLNP